MELGDKHLKVVHASIGVTQASGLDMGVSAMSMFAKTTSQDLEAGRVLQLLNMVTADELMDNDDYEGTFPIIQRGTFKDAELTTFTQKSAKTSEMSAQNTVRLLT